MGADGVTNRESYQLLHQLGGGEGVVKTNKDISNVDEAVGDICNKIADFTEIQFQGIRGQEPLNRADVKGKIRENDGGVREFKKLLRSKDRTDVAKLARNIRLTYPNLSEGEANEVAKQLHGIKLKLPKTASEKYTQALLLAPRFAAAGGKELLSGMLAGTLGVLWKANLDPKDPIKDPTRPPVLRVHGLKDTQGSSLPLWALVKARRSMRNRLNSDGKEIKYGSGYSLSYAGLFHNNSKQTVDDYVSKVADKLIDIRRQTGQKRIIMEGHSLGGLVINRFAQLQEAAAGINQLEGHEAKLAQAKILVGARTEENPAGLEIQPKIYQEMVDLAGKYKPGAGLSRDQERLVARLVGKLPEHMGEEKKMGFENRMREVLLMPDDDTRVKLANNLAEDLAAEWFVDLCSRLDPGKEEGGSMEAKWMISICTPYGGSHFATRMNAVERVVGMRPSRIIGQLEKRNSMASIIADDTRAQVKLGNRNVRNITCKTTDEFVSDGSASVNYDPRYRKVFKDKAHLGVLVSTDVADAMGKWVDEFVEEISELAVKAGDVDRYQEQVDQEAQRAEGPDEEANSIASRLRRSTGQMMSSVVDAVSLLREPVQDS